MPSPGARHRAICRLLQQRKLARTDPNTFIEYVMCDEQEKPLRQAPFQEEWQNILTAQKRAVIMAPVEHGKTVQISIARPLFEMGKRQTVRILLVMAAAHQAYKRLAAVKNNIEFNPRVREVFPDLRRDRFGIWATSHIDVMRERATTQHDYTMQAVGVGSDILGSRIDIAILDDVLNFANTGTAEQRQKIIDWFETTLLNRVVDGGVIWVLGTAWHKKDLLHYLSKLIDFSAHRYSAEDGQGGNPIWPAQWSEERLAERRRTLTPWRYAQQLLCKAIDDETARFDSDWFARCRLLGRGLLFPSRRYAGTVVTGLDLAIGLKKKHHETAFFTLGNEPETEKRQPLYIAHGRWKKREIIRRAKAIHKRYGGIFVVENNQAQNYLVQDLEETKIPVIPYTTGKRKLHPEFGIESIGVELENRKWLIASDKYDRQPEDLALWEEQCMDWRPAEHPGDILMASFFALEGLRRFDYGEDAIDVG